MLIIFVSLHQGGRQDPMVKLKKQLAEKEKALCDEQEAHQAIQSKLKELRAELNVEKHANRQFEETLNARQMDLQALNARLQAMAEEKQTFSKQLQQVRLFSLVSQHINFTGFFECDSKCREVVGLLKPDKSYLYFTFYANCDFSHIGM